MKNKPRLILIIFASVLILLSIVCGYKVHALSARQEKIKEDYAIINNVSFGLLSINKWRDKIVVAVQNQIQNFDLTKEQEVKLQKEIEQILNSLLNKAMQMINKPKKSLGGKIKKAVIKTFVDEDELRRQVPSFAGKILQQIEKPSSKERLEDLATSKLKQLGRQTYDSARDEEKLTINSVFHKYGVITTAAFDKKTTANLTTIRRQTYEYAFGMLGCVVVILSLWGFLRKKEDLHKPLFILSVLAALVLLFVGLTTTMIELDARIKSIDFKLIGITISFNNQVLFFQSKSILDVVKIMFDTGKWDMIIVGSLIFSFSVVFPFFKLFSTLFYLLGKKPWMKGKVVHYFAFKSGKWSMADVTVVAIMMTYIGFNGVLESQLASLNIHSESISSITTNNTALQPGYIVFVCFVVYGLILSQILKNIMKEQTE